MEYVYDARLSDKQRSAFGLGWEHHRRGWPMDGNPFEPGSQRYDWFQEGWQQFRDTDLQLYLEKRYSYGI